MRKIPEDAPLGVVSDHELARRYGVVPSAVGNLRRRRGIPACGGDRGPYASAQGELAYALGAGDDTLSWREIDHRLGYAVGVARLAAAAHAQARGLPWPLPRARFQPDRALSGAIYRRKAENPGESWGSIAQELGVPGDAPGQNAEGRARYFARRAGLPWPPGAGDRPRQGEGTTQTVTVCVEISAEDAGALAACPGGQSAAIREAVRLWLTERRLRCPRL